MPTSGIISLIIVVLSFSLIIVFRKKIHEYSNKYKWIKYVVAGICFAYFLTLRYIPDIVSYSSMVVNDDYTQYLKSVYLSKMLLLDACPFIAMYLPFMVFMNNSLRVPKIMAPLGIIGSLVTIFGQIIWEDINMNDYLHYLFIGFVPNRLYFMMHLLNLLLATYILVISTKFNLKDLVYTFGFYEVWFLYMIIFVLCFNIQYNATGLVINDWVDSRYGEYHKLYLFWKLPYPIITIFWYFVAILVNYLIIAIKNISDIKKFIITTILKRSLIVKNDKK